MNDTTRRTFGLGLAAAPLLTRRAMAQDAYPSRSIRAVITIGAGAAGDLYLRQIAAKASQLLGQTIVVDNRPGGAGLVGTAAVARAAPDGYTLILAYNQTMVVAPHIYKELPYDPLSDFVGVARAVSTPLVLVASATLPVKSVAEVVAWAKAHPQQLSYASSGKGTSSHLAGAYFENLEKVGAQHVAYTSVPQALGDIERGDIKIMFYPYLALQPAIERNSVHVLATTGTERLSTLPQVPTMAELGYRDFVITPWFAFYAPAKTPPQIVQKLSTTINEALKEPEFVAAMNRTGTAIWPSTPEEMVAFTKSEIERYRNLVAIAGIERGD